MPGYWKCRISSPEWYSWHCEANAPGYCPILPFWFHFYTLKWFYGSLSTTAHANSIEPFMTPEEVACNLQIASSDVTLWLCCSVGNVGASFWKGGRMCKKKRKKNSASAVWIYTIWVPTECIARPCVKLVELAFKLLRLKHISLQFLCHSFIFYVFKKP